MYANARFLLSASQARDFPPDKGSEVAFAGRSNSGKSSVLNAITARRALARISKTPGRTQLINFFTLDEHRRLVDLPGYGFARVPDAVRAHWRGLMSAYFEQRVALRGLVLIVDIRRGVGELDLQMLAWARARAQGLGVLVLLNKADKLGRSAALSALAEAREALGPGAAVQLLSALRGTGVEEARTEVARQLGLAAEQ